MSTVTDRIDELMERCSYNQSEATAIVVAEQLAVIAEKLTLLEIQLLGIKWRT